MGHPRSLNSNAHIRAVMTAAIESPSGLGIEALNKVDAIRLRNVANSIRKQHRDALRQVLEGADLQTMMSPWDELSFILKPHPVKNPAGLDDMPWMLVFKKNLLEDLTILDPATGQEIKLGENKK